MPEQRRYGTAKSEKPGGPSNSTATTAADAAAGKPTTGTSIPSYQKQYDTGERREIRAAPKGSPVSERVPLLLDSSSDHNGNGGGNNSGRRGPHGGGGSGGGGIVAADAFAAGSSRRDNNRVLTALLVLNYMIGSGILNSPQVFKSSGIGVATILYIVAGLVTLCFVMLTSSYCTNLSNVCLLLHLLIRNLLYCSTRSYIVHVVAVTAASFLGSKFDFPSLRFF